MPYSTPSQHGTRWTTDEHAKLMAGWTGHKADTEALADQLGRTVKACEGHVYGTRDGSVPDPAQLKPDFDPTTSHRTAEAAREAEYLGLFDRTDPGGADDWWNQDWNA